MEKKIANCLEMEWIYDAMNAKWYLYRNDEEKPIAEVGVEDAELEGEKSYYWIDCYNQCGYGDYPTYQSAMNEAEQYCV